MGWGCVRPGLCRLMWKGIMEREGRVTCRGYVCHVAFFQEFLRAWRPVPSECAPEDFAVLRTSCLWWTLQRQVREPTHQVDPQHIITPPSHLQCNPRTHLYLCVIVKIGLGHVFQVPNPLHERRELVPLKGRHLRSRRNLGTTLSASPSCRPFDVWHADRCAWTSAAIPRVKQET